MNYTLKAGFLNKTDIVVNKATKTMYTNDKEFSAEDMKEIKASYKGVNRIHKPIAILFYTDVLNGENVRKNYGEENVLITKNK